MEESQGLEPRNGRASLGWFREGGAFDKADKGLSAPIFLSEISKLEYVLSVPGCFFGLPIAAWGSLPFLIGAYAASVLDAPTGWKVLLTGFLPSFVAVNALWFKYLQQEKPGEAYMLTKKLIVPLVVVPPLFARVFFISAYSPICFVCSAWFLANSIVHAMKITSRRARPMVALREELKGIHRELASIPRIVGRGEGGYHSFPSGDACGATVYSTTLYLLGSRNPFVFAAPVVLSSYGRIYFHCHHLSDVLVGNLIGFMITHWLNSRIGIYGFSALHSSFFAFGFIACIIIARLLFKFEVPPEDRDEGGIFEQKQD